MDKKKNIVGDQIRKLRYERGLTQDELAARCQVDGLELSRATLSKIEAGLRCVADAELPLLAKSLKVDLIELFPAKSSRRRGPG
jgi:transcriptional regulator with XRE-family HTH domain